MSNAYFAFRQFGIRQDRCAMKVSMDACIFGAWIPVPENREARIMDIGAGTGLLSLMLAQRHEGALIDAVELDKDAARQAADNCADSIFARRVHVAFEDARSFLPPSPCDLIVSNPPFFRNSLKGRDAARNRARHTGDLDLGSLFDTVVRTLKKNGSFALLMPADAEPFILKTAARCGLQVAQQLLIRNRAGFEPTRCCWLLRYVAPGMPHVQELIIRGDDGAYSAAFRALLRSYYLLL